jgi:hypothetical protein
MRNKAFDATVKVVLALLALTVAYVCFEVLNSQADGESYEFVLQGAIAAWVVSFTLFTSVYLQFRKSDDKDLYERIEELQQKLIRGRRILPASRPRWPSGRGSCWRGPTNGSTAQYESLPKVVNERADAPSTPKAAGARAGWCGRGRRDIRGERPDANPRSKKSWYGPRSTRQTRQPTSPLEETESCTS